MRASCNLEGLRGGEQASLLSRCDRLLRLHQSTTPDLDLDHDEFVTPAPRLLRTEPFAGQESSPLAPETPMQISIPHAVGQNINWDNVAYDLPSGYALASWKVVGGTFPENIVNAVYRDASGCLRRRFMSDLDGIWHELRRILRGVDELPDDRREALIMRFALGMDNREIARAMGRTDGATKVLIHRAIKQLEQIVAAEGAPTA